MFTHLKKRVYLCLIFSTLLVGCAGSDVSVSGKVSYGDQPVDRGVIEFIEVNNGPSFSDVITEGHYKLQAASGDYRVRITGIRAEHYEKPHKNRPDLPASGLIDVSYIPAVYNSETTLRATVSPKESVHDFNLEAVK
ncbi:MAG: hypothetical protein Q4G68_12135 [Planctomycetia bacterium]|nr:hypothetical protein [Planctomycetia bacterium]